MSVFYFDSLASCCVCFYLFLYSALVANKGLIIRQINRIDFLYYRCALRRVALRGERHKKTPIVFLFLSPRNATQRNAQP